MSAFQPSRILTVTGTFTAARIASTMRRTAIGLAAERRAEAHAREVIDRAAEIEIDEIGAARFDERRGPRHLVRLVAGELHAEARLVRRAADQRELAAPALLQPPRDDHLADEHARAELDAQPPVRQIRALRHRRHDDRAREGFAEET